MTLPLTRTPPTAAAGTATHRAKQSSRVGLPPRGASLAPSPHLARPSHPSPPHPRRSVRRSNSRQAAGQWVASRGAKHTVTVRSFVSFFSNSVAAEGVWPIKCLPASRSPLDPGAARRSPPLRAVHVDEYIQPLTTAFSPSCGCLEHSCRPHAHRRSQLQEAPPLAA